MSHIEADMVRGYAAVRKRLFAAPKRAEKPTELPPPKPDPVMTRRAIVNMEWKWLITVPAPKNDNRRQRPPSIREIIRATAQHFRISPIDLISQRRTKHIVRPRQIAMYVAKTLTTRSLPEIGRQFEGRDHTTALSAIRRIEALRAIDPDIDEAVRALLSELGTEAKAPGLDSRQSPHQSTPTRCGLELSAEAAE